MGQKGSALDLSEYILRVVTDDYRYRLSFKPQQTYGELLDILSHKTGIPPQQLQVFSETGRRLNIRPQKKLKEVVYLRHGCILKVDLAPKEKRAASPQSNIYIRSSIAPTERKSKCKHPSNMRCISCQPTQKENTQYAGNGLLTTAQKPSPEDKRRKCDHGANMKCLNCLSTGDKHKVQKERNEKIENKIEKEPIMIGGPLRQQDKKKSKLKLTVASPKNNPQSPQICRHTPNIRCSKCINSPRNTLRNSKSQPSISTLPILSPQKQKAKSPQKKTACLHGELGRCLNCLPQSKQKQPISQNKKNCLHGPNSKCIHCLQPSANKAAHMAFDQYLKNKSINCLNHPPDQECPNCQPPKNPRLFLNKNCDQHQPYPKGLCNRCLPENLSLKSQEYRHVDYVQFMNGNQMQDFLRYWVQQKKMDEIRVAQIYGYYAQDPFYKQGIRAIVEAIYEPQQQCTKTSFIIKDSKKKQDKVQSIVASLGLERIGLLIASPQEEGYFTEEQMRIIADLQESLSVNHENGYKLSNFFTVLVKANKADPKKIEPQVFMVSDQAQALQAASMFVPNPNNPLKMKLKQSELQILPQIYHQGKSITEIDIQFFLVKIASGVSKTNKFAILKNNEFPTPNRGGIKKSIHREYLNKNFKKPCSIKYGDLNLLVFLCDLIDTQTANELARRIESSSQIDPSVDELISKKMQALI